MVLEAIVILASLKDVFFQPILVADGDADLVKGHELGAVRRGYHGRFLAAAGRQIEGVAGEGRLDVDVARPIRVVIQQILRDEAAPLRPAELGDVPRIICQRHSALLDPQPLGAEGEAGALLPRGHPVIRVPEQLVAVGKDGVQRQAVRRGGVAPGVLGPLVDGRLGPVQAHVQENQRPCRQGQDQRRHRQTLFHGSFLSSCPSASSRRVWLTRSAS